MRERFPSFDSPSSSSSSSSSPAPPRLCAVVGETIDLKGFRDAFAGGDVFLDKGNQLKLALSPEGAKHPRTTGLGFFFSPAFWASYRRAGQKYPEMAAQQNSQDGLKLGGVLLVGAGRNGGAGGQLLFKHLETAVGSIADPDELKAALGRLTDQGATLVEG